MTEMRPLNDTELWLMNLERERFNVAYRVPAEPQIEVREVKVWQTKPCHKAHASEKRDQMMFNAGRFAAGATDKTAVEAHQKLMAELEK